MSLAMCCLPMLYLPAGRQQPLLLPPSPTSVTTEGKPGAGSGEDSHQRGETAVAGGESPVPQVTVSREPTRRGEMKVLVPDRLHVTEALASPRCSDDPFAPPTPRFTSFTSRTSLSSYAPTVPPQSYSPSVKQSPAAVASATLTRAPTAASSIAADYRARTRVPVSGPSLPPLPRPPSLGALSVISQVSLAKGKPTTMPSSTPPESRQPSRAPSTDTGRPFRVAGWSTSEGMDDSLPAPNAHFRGPSVHSTQSSLWGRLM